MGWLTEYPQSVAPRAKKKVPLASRMHSENCRFILSHEYLNCACSGHTQLVLCGEAEQFYFLGLKEGLPIQPLQIGCLNIDGVPHPSANPHHQ